MKKNIIKIFAMLLAIVWTSCLDDSKYALDPSATNNIVEFLDGSIPTNPSGAIYPVYTNTTEIVPEFTVELPVSFSGPNGNSEDIQLTLAVDPAALAAYNKQMEDDLGGSTYSLMPDDYYSFTSTSLTIPKGQTKASVSVTVFPDKFDLTKNFVVPIRIVSASSGILSAHFSVALVAVVVKNAYDGIYDVLDGQVIRLVNGVQDTNLGGQYVEGLTMDLATINGNTVAVVPLWRDGSGIGGIPGTQFSINQTTNAVTVTATGNASLANKPASINEYDPATKTFTVSFDWSRPNRGVYNLKLRYKKPRP
jgi:hypothetical protein